MQHKESRSFKALLSSTPIQVVLSLVLSWYAVRWLFRYSALPREIYTQTSIFISALSIERWSIFLLLGSLPFVIGWRSIRWREIDPEGRARWFVVGVAAVMTFTFCNYDYNFYYDQSYNIDRVILAALWALIFVHPGFLFPFLVAMMSFALQIHHPLPEPSWNWPDKRLPLYLLVALCSYLYVAIALRPKVKALLTVALMTTGALYAHAAISKMAIGPSAWTWLLEDNVSHMFVAAHLNGGWMGHLDKAEVIQITRLLEYFDRPMAAFTLFIEFAGVLLLLQRRFCQAILAGLILMHLGILMTTGIFFWKWMIIDGLLAWFAGGGARSTGRDSIRALWEASQKRLRLGLSALLFVSAVWHFYALGPLFAWWDTRYTNFFEFEATTKSGEVYDLNARFFAPYDIVMVQSRFYYLLPRPVLAGTYGVAHRYAVMHLLEDAELEDLPELLKTQGSVYFNEHAARLFSHFVYEFVTHASKYQHSTWPPRRVVPYHFQTSLPENTYRYQSPIKSITVKFKEYFFDGSEIHEIKSTKAMVVDISK